MIGIFWSFAHLEIYVLLHYKCWKQCVKTCKTGRTTRTAIARTQWNQIQDPNMKMICWMDFLPKIQMYGDLWSEMCWIKSCWAEWSDDQTIVAQNLSKLVDSTFCLSAPSVFSFRLLSSNWNSANDKMVLLLPELYLIWTLGSCKTEKIPKSWLN